MRFRKVFILADQNYGISPEFLFVIVVLDPFDDAVALTNVQSKA
jgi:hypothetical protein